MAEQEGALGGGRFVKMAATMLVVVDRKVEGREESGEQ
jgi:hypothetical protein